jgi:hypothetical protein
MVLIGVSFVVQLASLMFWLPLEIYQMETLGHPTFGSGCVVQEHRGIRHGEDGCGIEHDDMGYDPGLRAHHDVEFLSLSAASSRSRTAVGRGYRIRHLGRCSGSACDNVMEAQGGDDANGSLRVLQVLLHAVLLVPIFLSPHGRWIT